MASVGRPSRPIIAAAALIAAVIGISGAARLATAAETVHYIYDSLNRLTEVRYSEAVIRYTYDAAGNRLTRQVENLLKLSVNDISASEGNAGMTNATLTVTLSGPSTRSVTADYATADGTAVAGMDYVAASGTLSFPPGTIEQTVTVQVIGETFFEGNESFTLGLQNAVNAGLAKPVGGTTILDDDALPAISISDITVAERNSGTTAAVFNVSLSSPNTMAVTVQYATADGTATTADGEYLPASGSLTFTPGTFSQAIVVTVNGDTKHEADETFVVDLSNPANATLADGRGVGTIVNDDPRPTASVGDCSVMEGNSGTVGCVFNVSLSAPSGTEITIYYDTADDTATAGTDYVPTAGTLSFPPGSTTWNVTVQVNGDTVPEPDESFFLNVRTRTPLAAIANAGSHEVSTFTIEPAGAMTAVPGSPDAAGTEPTSVAIDPAGKIALAGNAGSHDISAYLVDASTGALDPVVGAPFAAGTAPSGVTIDPSGRFAYVANSGSDDVAGYAVDATTGALSPIEGSPFAAGTTPSSVAIDRSGRFLYVANKGSQNLSAFAIDTATGSLAPITGSPFAAGNGPVSVAIDPRGRYVFAGNSPSNTLSAYAMNATTGALTPVAGSPFATRPSPQSLTVSPSGRFLYVASVDSDSVSAYAIDGATGALSELPGSPFPAGSSPTSVALLPSGQFAYVTNSLAGEVSAYSADSVTGALTPVPGSPFAAAAGSRSVATTHPADARAQGTIRDDDKGGRLVFSAARYSVSEAGGFATITVERRGGLASGVTVQYATGGGTAISGSDYVATSGTLTFGAGVTSQTFTIPILNDTISEGNEAVILTLSNPTGGATLRVRRQTTLRIMDDDQPSPLPVVVGRGPGHGADLLSGKTEKAVGCLSKADLS